MIEKFKYWQNKWSGAIKQLKNRAMRSVKQPKMQVMIIRGVGDAYLQREGWDRKSMRRVEPKIVIIDLSNEVTVIDRETTLIDLYDAIRWTLGENE